MDIQSWLTRQSTSFKDGQLVTDIVQPSMEGFFDFLKTKRKKPDVDEKPRMKADNEQALRSNYLNDGWLDKQSYVEGPVSFGKEGVLLFDKGRKPRSVLDLLEKSVQQHKTQLDAHYKKVGDVVRKSKAIIGILNKPNWKDNLTPATHMWVGGYFDLFEKPIKPKLKVDAGGIDLNKGDVTSIEAVYDLAVKPSVSELPTLDKKGVKQAAQLILQLFEMNDREFEMQAENYMAFFGKVGSSPSFRNPVPVGNPWHEELIKIDKFVNPGYTELYLCRDALIKSIAKLIDKSVK